MTQPDLYGNSIFTQGIYYTGETIDTRIIIDNNGTEDTDAFDVDIYLSTDETIDSNDRYLTTGNFADGIEGKRFSSSRANSASTPISFTLPDSDDSFWIDEQEEYYLGTIVDSENAIAESDETNNSDYSGLISIQQTDLPVVNLFREYDTNTIDIELSAPAPEGGLTIDYRAVTKEDYINDVDEDYWFSPSLNPDFEGGVFYDSELDRLYLTGESYYDLSDYKYYDTAGGHYDPEENKYFNADGSYYDVAEKLFYDVNGNATELTDNRTEYDPFYTPAEDIDGDGIPDNDGSFDYLYNPPRHYLPTGGYISFNNDFFYDVAGGYIADGGISGTSYFSQEDYEGFGNSQFGDSISGIREGYTGAASIELLPRVATLGEDYELVSDSNITDITDSTITIAPGETTATVNLNFLPDLVYDPKEQAQLELLEDEAYIVGRSPIATRTTSYYNNRAPRVGLEELENPESGILNFNVPENADPGTVVGQVNFSDPHRDELTYSLVRGRASDEAYTPLGDEDPYIDLDPEIIETSNQDLDNDGIPPFSIDPSTGVITLTDYDDLDREPSYIEPVYDDEFGIDIFEERVPQLYNSEYYQLFVKVTDGTIDPEWSNYPNYSGSDDNQLYEASLVNIKVISIPTTTGDDDVEGFSSSDIIRGLAGNDTIRGLAGNDTLIGNAGDDSLDGGIGDDTLNAGIGNDELFGGEGNDTLNGISGNNTLDGGAGNDELYGGMDDDILYGMDGSDTFYGIDGNDEIFGGAGDDFAYGMNGDDTLNGGDGNDKFLGGAGKDLLAGNGGDDTLNGGAGDDTLDGELGNDFLNGGLGNDLISGMEGNDILIGLNGDDTLDGDSGKDILFGMDENDVINGGEDKDTLNGGGGDDTLKGGAGIDRLSGKAGADVFVLEVGVGQDLIIDFEDGVDRLGLSGDLSFEHLNIVDLAIYSSTQIYDPVNNQILAVLSGVEPSLITEADFTTV